MAAQDERIGITTLDVETAFLNTPMPKDEPVYARPLNLLVQYNLVVQNQIWRLDKAVNGLRTSPRLWGQCRDECMTNMRISWKNRTYKLLQSNIDQPLWAIVQSEGYQFLHDVKKVGYVLTYVDDFMMIAEKSLRSKFEEDISRHWKIKVTGSIDQDGSGRSLTFLSMEIGTTSSGGFFMNQEKFINDLSQTWKFVNCKPSCTPGVKGSSVSLEEMTPDEIDSKDVHQAQKLARSLIWLSARTRPDITYAQSRISNLATTNPILALEEGKRVLISFQEIARLERSSAWGCEL